MTRYEYDFVASEVTELKRLLNIIPTENIIERIGLQYRLEEAQKSLQGMQTKAVFKNTRNQSRLHS